MLILTKKYSWQLKAKLLLTSMYKSRFWKKVSGGNRTRSVFDGNKMIQSIYVQACGFRPFVWLDNCQGGFVFVFQTVESLVVWCHVSPLTQAIQNPARLPHAGHPSKTSCLIFCLFFYSILKKHWFSILVQNVCLCLWLYTYVYVRVHQYFFFCSVSTVSPLTCHILVLSCKCSFL